MIPTSKMFSSFLAIFGTWVAVMGMCQASTLDRSNLAPLSIVYTVYPYYDSETILGVLKAEEPLQHTSNVFPLERESETQEARNPGNVGSHDESSGDSNNPDSSHDDSNDARRQRTEQPTEITYWPPVQRGAAPKPRLGRASNLRPTSLKNNA